MNVGNQINHDGRILAVIGFMSLARVATRHPVLLFFWEVIDLKEHGVRAWKPSKEQALSGQILVIVRDYVCGEVWRKARNNTSYIHWRLSAPLVGYFLTET